MMKKIKKIIVFAMMMVMLICSCMPVAAATEGVNDRGHEHSNLTLYDKIEVNRRYLYTHTEHNGVSTVTCTVYEAEYVVRYRCNGCGNIISTATEYKEIHVK